MYFFFKRNKDFFDFEQVLIYFIYYFKVFIEVFLMLSFT